MDAPAPVFPPYGEADWRKAAEAALKGRSVESLASATADGIRLEPLYTAGEGPRAVGAVGPWRVLARVDHPDAGEANAQAFEDLGGGADGLRVVFSGAVGAHGFGLKRSDSATLHAAFDGVRFDAGPSFELDLGPDAGRSAAFAALIERAGAKPGDCQVSFGLDPFAVCALGSFPNDFAAHAAPYVEAALALKRQGFLGPFMVADARSVHAAGGGASHELAFALGGAVAMLRALSAAGVALDEARRMIAFRLAADADQFVSLSKFRALRLAVARVEEACGLKPEKARVEAETAWRMMTARDPYVNVMRGAIAAFSAGLGGADSVSVLPHTLAAGLPDSRARRLARNAQLILLRESNLGFVADPAAGAGAFEALGGLPAALASGAFQRRVEENAAALRLDAARLKAPLTGVSAHPDLAEPPADLAPAAPAPERLAAAGALSPIRLAEPCEALRDESDAILAKNRRRPRVCLIAIGPEPSHRRRVSYMREWFEVGGFETAYDGESDAPDEARARLERSGADFVCLCGDDGQYAAHAESFAEALKSARPRRLIVAGRAGEREAALREAGVTDFVFAGADAVAILQSLYRSIAA